MHPGYLLAMVMIVLLWAFADKVAAADNAVTHDPGKTAAPESLADGNRLPQQKVLSSPVAEVIPPVRDPFMIPPALLQQMNMGRTATGPGNGDNRAGNGYFRAQPGQLPRVKMRGIMRSSGSSDPIALLEVDGGEVYMVRENDEISLDGGLGNNAIRVIRIERLSVLIEVGTLGERMILR